MLELDNSLSHAVLHIEDVFRSHNWLYRDCITCVNKAQSIDRHMDCHYCALSPLQVFSLPTYIVDIDTYW